VGPLLELRKSPIEQSNNNQQPTKAAREDQVEKSIEKEK
jgi:hypothetical protein